MKVKFWGTRGSIPTPFSAEAMTTRLKRVLARIEKTQEPLESALPFEERATFGGETSCVQVDTGEGPYYLFDAGSGLRHFGNAVVARSGQRRERTFHLFLSHLHWDHLMGIPFFAPAYYPGNRLIFHSCHEKTEWAIRTLFGPPYFPVPFEALGGKIEFSQHGIGEEFRVEPFKVQTILQNHAGDSTGWRIEGGGRSVVYSTDCEHKKESRDPTYPFVDFFRAADLLIFDAQYSLAETITLKEDWGHSSNVVAVELAQRAGVRRLCLFHHEPNFDDVYLARILADARRYNQLVREGLDDSRLEILSAHDGLEVTLA